MTISKKKTSFNFWLNSNLFPFFFFFSVFCFLLNLAKKSIKFYFFLFFFFLAEGLLKNGDFEFGTNHWVGSVGTIFSTVGERFHGGQLCGRIHIPISNYQSNRPAKMLISQAVQVNSVVRGFVLAAFSMVEQLFGDGSDVDYRIELQVLFKDGTTFVWEDRFSSHVRTWQYRSFTIHLTQFVAVEKVTVYCILGALRGAVYFDDVRLLRLD